MSNEFFYIFVKFIFDTFDMKNSIIADKSLNFAIRIVNLYKHLCVSKKEFIMSKQLLRSGTSIGANVSEALNSESTKDFIHKLSISQKETAECLYWLKLLKATDFLTEPEYESINTDAETIFKIIKRIIITSKKSITSKITP